MKYLLFTLPRILLVPLILLVPSTAPSMPNATASTQADCGHWRWPVKTGSDADRFKVTATPQVTKIKYLSTRAVPSNLESLWAQNHRVSWVERRTWELRHTTLVKTRLQPDGDIHLILANAAGKTMIAEIPKPTCVPDHSLWKTQITKARHYLTARYPASTTWTIVNRPVDIQGLGFFDSLHGQAEAADNGIELHPGTELKFLS